MKADELVATMRSFIGIVENPPGSNRTPIGEEFGWNGVPWCAETVSVACGRNGFPLHTAAVIEIERLARQGWHGMWWSEVPIYASAVCFDWKHNGNPADMHTGLVVDVHGDGTIRTCEGNYRDRVAEWTRDMTFVRGFACFPFESTEPTPVPVPPTPPPKEKIPLLFLVQVPGDTAWYWTDWLTKSWCHSAGEAAFVIAQTTIRGGQVASAPGYQPLVLNDANVGQGQGQWLVEKLLSLPVNGPDEP